MEENQPSQQQSGYISKEETYCYTGATMRDVEVIATTATNIIAVGRRYGRRWFLKGLIAELRESAVMRRRLIKEFELHSRLRHHNIVQPAGLEEIEGLGLCIIQEWVEGITLRDALRSGTLTSADRLRVMRELTAAVASLHRSGVVHRDIKPANVMIRETGGEVVLVDFGLADSDDYVESKGPAGTVGFISPEQMEEGGVSARDDVYSLGVVMRELVPRYRRIADRCTGVASRRYKDAGELLKALGRRDRRRKIGLATVIVMVVAVMAAVALWRIAGLEHSTDDSRRNISVLEEKNARNERLVTTLRDSLAQVRSRLSDAESELTRVAEYENMRQKIFKEGCRRIDNVLDYYGREVVPKISAAGFTDMMIELAGQLNSKIENYNSSISDTSLSPQDKEKIRMDLYNYNAVKLSEYQNKWLKKLKNQEI